MDEPNIRGTTRRELLGGAAVVLGSPVLGFREDAPEPLEEEPGGNCGSDYDAEYEELFEAAEDLEVDDRSLAAAKWSRPIRKRARVTMRYGVRGSWLAGYHTGVDLAVSKGTPVYAVGTGVVVLASWSGSYGKAVTIKMSDSRYVLYAHLSRISLRGPLPPPVRLGHRPGEIPGPARSEPLTRVRVRVPRGTCSSAVSVASETLGAP
jgi:hypothetical protein